VPTINQQQQEQPGVGAEEQQPGAFPTRIVLPYGSGSGSHEGGGDGGEPPQCEEGDEELYQLPQQQQQQQQSVDGQEEAATKSDQEEVNFNWQAFN
jgi:hypothetical protein